jgi:hypothetical protein
MKRDQKHWKRKAKRWLADNNVINGYNGLWGTETAEEWVNSLAKTFERIHKSMEKTK